MNNVSNIVVNNFVRLNSFKEDHPNGYARVNKVSDTGVYVSNMNQPFQGSYSNEFFTFDEVTLVS